jgi:predicted amidohydrolase YtcJ
VFADHVFTNAAMFRPAGREPADTVAVRSDTITYVGRGVVDGLVGPKTEIIDLSGASLVPGFIDAHAHPIAAGMQALRCDFSELAHDRGLYRAAVDRYAHDHPDELTIVGSGWYGDAFRDGFPNREDLDDVVADRPVVLTGHDGHSVWVNTRALEMAGIDEHTPDPNAGRIMRDGDGRPTGVLLEHAADAVNDLIGDVTPQFMYRALMEAQRQLHAVGVTGWQDAAVGATFFGMKDIFPTYLDADAAGELTAHVVGALWWEADQALGQIDRMCARRAEAGHARFTATAVKVMQDGICENCTAAMLAPYRAAARADDLTGVSFIDPDELKKVSSTLTGQQFAIHMHAVGDRAVRECLDALQAAKAEHPDIDVPHQIAHLDVVDPQDIPRFARLGVIANVQALWARRDKEIVERKLPLLGAQREKWHFPFASIQRHGARLAMGSDWPVTDPNPLWAIHTAVHRTGTHADPHATGADVFDHPLEPQEAITLRSALEAYTIGSAIANNCSDRTGSIETDKLADLVVLDQNIVHADDIGTVRPVLTMVSGEIVHLAD